MSGQGVGPGPGSFGPPPGGGGGWAGFGKGRTWTQSTLGPRRQLNTAVPVVAFSTAAASAL